MIMETKHHTKSMLKRPIIFCIAILSSGVSYAQETVATTSASQTSNWSNPLFWLMVFAVVALLAVIIAMGSLLIGLVETKTKSSAVKKTAGLLVAGFFLAGTQSASAQAAGFTAGLSNTTFNLLLAIVVIEVLVILYMYYIMRRMIMALGFEKERKSKWSWPSIRQRLTGSVPVEKETDIATDHNYDGIIELDNNLPPWWKYLFYVTIIFAFGYMYYYHFGSGKLQIAEYEESVKVAEQKQKQNLQQSTNAVDETNVTYLADEASIGKGKTAYATKCAVCHGQAGEGGVGPNLADAYWIHGGSIQDIFKTIKYGVPEKGMVPWQAQMPPAEMQMVASYIKSLAGTDPANAKEPQGELYKEEIVPAGDSTQVQSDNTASQ